VFSVSPWSSECPFTGSEVEKEIEISLLYLGEWISCQLKCSGVRGREEIFFLAHMHMQYKERNIYQHYQSKEEEKRGKMFTGS
jgi:hypothetical protein